MCDVRGCSQPPTKYYFMHDYKWVKAKKIKFIKSFLICKRVCSPCHTMLINNAQGGDKRLVLGGR